MIDDLLQKIDDAFAENTLKAYRSDFADFTAWCCAEGLEPWGSTATDWARYIGDREPLISAATLRRRIHSLNSLFHLANQRPHGDSSTVRLALRRMHRRKGRRQKQATPLTRSILNALLAQCDNSLRGRRNRVLLMLGYETMRRRAELVSFRFDHLECLPGGIALPSSFHAQKPINLGKAHSSAYRRCWATPSSPGTSSWGMAISSAVFVTKKCSPRCLAPAASAES